MFFKTKNKDLALSQGYWANIKRQYRQSKRAMLALYVVTTLVLVAIFAPLLANDKPIVAKYEGKWMFPIFKTEMVALGLSSWTKAEAQIINDWQAVKFDWAVRTPIPYGPTFQDWQRQNKKKSPLEAQNVASWRWRHWLGTTPLGKDVVAVMIYGTRTALSIGLIAMSIAAFIGILMGGVAGFFGDDKFFMSRASVLLALPTLFFAYFYGLLTRSYALETASSLGIFPFLKQLFFSFLIIGIVGGVGFLLAKALKQLAFFNKKIRIPIDFIISRIIEIFTTIPSLIFILAFAAVLQNTSIFNIMVIIGLISWTSIARFMRGELLRIRELPYIEAAKALGFSQWRTLFYHAIPNALSPVLTTIAFGIAAAILLEATLSFIGIGGAIGDLTWGGLLKQSKESTALWWLAVVPGLAIFVTVTCFNLVGEGLTDAMEK